MVKHPTHREQRRLLSRRRHALTQQRLPLQETFFSAFLACVLGWVLALALMAGGLHLFYPGVLGRLL